MGSNRKKYEKKNKETKRKFMYDHSKKLTVLDAIIFGPLNRKIKGITKQITTIIKKT